MTGEELNRRYWELCGWSAQREPSLRPRGYHGCKEWWIKAGGGIFPELPRLHLDANLAIAEALSIFRRWETGYRYQQGHVFWFDGFLIGRVSAIHDCSGRGETFCLAVLNALIAAKEQQ